MRRPRKFLRVVGHVTDKPPTPSRITEALDACGLFGPEVDAALGVPEPTVDMWEQGTIIPTTMDVERLSALTEFPLAHFYKPARKPFDGIVFLCGKGGCKSFDERPNAVVRQMERDTLR